MHSACRPCGGEAARGAARQTFEKNTPFQPHLIEDEDFSHPYNLRPRPVSNVVASSPRVPPSPEPVSRENLLQRLALALSGVRHSPKSTKLPTSHCNAVFDPISGVSHEYRTLSTGPDRDTWIRALANDIGRLAQGVGTRMPTGNNTMFFIRRSSVPTNKKVTYGRLVSTIRPNKAEKNRVRLTVGGDRLEYAGDASSTCAAITTVKLLVNSVISNIDAKFGCIDIKDFYYGTPLNDFEYMRLPIAIIPAEIILQYNLKELESDGYVYIEIRKGMPGLKQAGRIAQDRLVKHLAPFGYHPVKHTPSLWRNKTNSVTFALVVDDFGIKYTNKADFDHLLASLESLYTVTVDRTGSKFLGITLDWHYTGDRHVNLSMPDYVESALKRIAHPKPSSPHHAPHKWNQPIYGTHPQLALLDDESPPLPKSAAKTIQSIVGIFLYYAIAIDLTMLVALGTIATTQATPTEATMTKITDLLNYAATHPVATIRYNPSQMVLHVHSDASYLSESNARSRAAGIFFLGNHFPNASQPSMPLSNGVVHVLCKLLKNVMSSAAEAEIGSAFLAAKEALPLRVALIEMGHPQPPTPIQVDNTTAVGFANSRIKLKATKAIDMRFYWIRDRIAQNQFLVYWGPGDGNSADYVSKHHSPKHHQIMRPTFFVNRLQCVNNVISCLLRGCNNSNRISVPNNLGTRH